MARFIQIRELEARKRALVAESEICRQTLMVDLQNRRTRVSELRDRLAFFSSLGPFLAAALPLAGSLLRRRRARGSWLRLVVALAFRSGLHLKQGGLLCGLLARRRARAQWDPAARAADGQPGARRASG